MIELEISQKKEVFELAEEQRKEKERLVRLDEQLR